MVKIRQDHPIDHLGEVDVAHWLERIKPRANLDEQSISELAKSCQLAHSVSDTAGKDEYAWGEGYTSFHAGLEMAEILLDLHLDGKSLCAAVLYRAVRESKLSIDKVRDEIDETVAKLISGVQKMAAISGLSNQARESAFGLQSKDQAENIRKMLVAMVDDVRVALIKLAERTCAIRAVKKATTEKRQQVAREVSDIYAPLAHRLGIGHIKWELEDLAFRYLQPFDYKYIAKLLDEKRVDRETYIKGVITLLESTLAKEDIQADIFGRAKHIFSIWRKMRRKNISFSEVYDIRAVRILVNSERECYTVLGLVHSLWRNIPHEFDDYIANPKENGYRSLHTAVSGPANRVLEVQIRTHEMHEEAEYGVCAHWRYKDTDKDDKNDSYEQKIEWLRQVLEWHDELGGSPWEDQLPKGIDQDRSYVFTPEGHIVDLPAEATPVDFAFRIHSDVGLRCRGAKVNGRIVPLNHSLKTADQVEVLTGKREAPSRDWLNSNLGYITTSRARSRLQAWFREQDRDQSIADGRAMLDHEFKRLGVDDLDFELLAQKLSLRSLEDLYVAVGTADISVERVIQLSQKLLQSEQSPEPVVSLVGRVADQSSGSDVYIDGVGNLLSSIAQCCHPLPGDKIAGYITVGRGVSIHKADCVNLLHRQAEEPDRIISVDWSEKPGQLYSVVIELEAFDRHGLLRDVATMLDREKINVSAMNTFSNKNKNTVEMNIHVEISDLSTLSRILAKLNHLPNVSSARRLS